MAVISRATSARTGGARIIQYLPYTMEDIHGLSELARDGVIGQTEFTAEIIRDADGNVYFVPIEEKTTTRAIENIANTGVQLRDGINTNAYDVDLLTGNIEPNIEASQRIRDAVQRAGGTPGNFPLHLVVTQYAQPIGVVNSQIKVRQSDGITTPISLKENLETRQNLSYLERAKMGYPGLFGQYEGRIYPNINTFASYVAASAPQKGDSGTNDPALDYKNQRSIQNQIARGISAFYAALEQGPENVLETNELSSANFLNNITNAIKSGTANLGGQATDLEKYALGFAAAHAAYASLLYDASVNNGDIPEIVQGPIISWMSEINNDNQIDQETKEGIKAFFAFPPIYSVHSILHRLFVSEDDFRRHSGKIYRTGVEVPQQVTIAGFEVTQAEQQMPKTPDLDPRRASTVLWEIIHNLFGSTSLPGFILQPVTHKVKAFQRETRVDPETGQPARVRKLRLLSPAEMASISAAMLSIMLGIILGEVVDNINLELRGIAGQTGEQTERRRQIAGLEIDDPFTVVEFTPATGIGHSGPIGLTFGENESPRAMAVRFAKREPQEKQDYISAPIRGYTITQIRKNIESALQSGGSPTEVPVQVGNQLMAALTVDKLAEILSRPAIASDVIGITPYTRDSLVVQVAPKTVIVNQIPHSYLVATPTGTQAGRSIEWYLPTLEVGESEVFHPYVLVYYDSKSGLFIIQERKLIFTRTSENSGEFKNMVVSISKLPLPEGLNPNNIDSVNNILKAFVNLLMSNNRLSERIREKTQKVDNLGNVVSVPIVIYANTGSVRDSAKLSTDNEMYTWIDAIRYILGVYPNTGQADPGITILSHKYGYMDENRIWRLVGTSTVLDYRERETTNEYFVPVFWELSTLHTEQEGQERDPLLRKPGPVLVVVDKTDRAVPGTQAQQATQPARGGEAAGAGREAPAPEVPPVEPEQAIGEGIGTEEAPPSEAVAEEAIQEEAPQEVQAGIPPSETARAESAQIPSVIGRGLNAIRNWLSRVSSQEAGAPTSAPVAETPSEAAAIRPPVEVAGVPQPPVQEEQPRPVQERQAQPPAQQPAQRQQAQRPAQQQQVQRQRSEPIIINSSTQATVGWQKQLSAFNLKLIVDEDKYVPVEVAYQLAKVFTNGAEYISHPDKDLLSTSVQPKAARDWASDQGRSGFIDRFSIKIGSNTVNFGRPQEVGAFYAWLYIMALYHFPHLKQKPITIDLKQKMIDIARTGADIRFVDPFARPGQSSSSQALRIFTYFAEDDSKLAELDNIFMPNGRIFTLRELLESGQALQNFRSFVALVRRHGLSFTEPGPQGGQPGPQGSQPGPRGGGVRPGASQQPPVQRRGVQQTRGGAQSGGVAQQGVQQGRQVQQQSGGATGRQGTRSGTQQQTPLEQQVFTSMIRPRGGGVEDREPHFAIGNRMLLRTEIESRIGVFGAEKGWTRDEIAAARKLGEQLASLKKVIFVVSTPGPNAVVARAALETWKRMEQNNISLDNVGIVVFAPHGLFHTQGGAISLSDPLFREALDKGRLLMISEADDTLRWPREEYLPDASYHVAIFARDFVIIPHTGSTRSVLLSDAENYASSMGRRIYSPEDFNIPFEKQQVGDVGGNEQSRPSGTGQHGRQTSQAGIAPQGARTQGARTQAGSGAQQQQQVRRHLEVKGVYKGDMQQGVSFRIYDVLAPKWVVEIPFADGQNKKYTAIGNPALLAGARPVAVAGTHRENDMDDNEILAAGRVADYLVQNGYRLVTGGAPGIDSQVAIEYLRNLKIRHDSGKEIKGYGVIIVLPNGIENGRENDFLHRIDQDSKQLVMWGLDNGRVLILSEFDDSDEFNKERATQRDTTVLWLANPERKVVETADRADRREYHVIVVSARNTKSGTYNVGKTALDSKFNVGVVDIQKAGNQALLRKGAKLLALIGGTETQAEQSEQEEQPQSRQEEQVEQQEEREEQTRRRARRTSAIMRNLGGRSGRIPGPGDAHLY